MRAPRPSFPDQRATDAASRPSGRGQARAAAPWRVPSCAHHDPRSPSSDSATELAEDRRDAQRLHISSWLAAVGIKHAELTVSSSRPTLLPRGRERTRTPPCYRWSPSSSPLRGRRDNEAGADWLASAPLAPPRSFTARRAALFVSPAAELFRRRGASQHLDGVALRRLALWSSTVWCCGEGNAIAVGDITMREMQITVYARQTWICLFEMQHLVGVSLNPLQSIPSPESPEP
jgi:hypothetical protein